MRVGREKWPGEWQTEARAMRQERLSSASESVLAPLWLCGVVPLANQGGRGEWPTWRTCPDWSERPISRSGMPARPRSRSLVQVQVVLPLLRELWDAVHAATFFQPRRLPGPLANGLCVSASHVRASRPRRIPSSVETGSAVDVPPSSLLTPSTPDGPCENLLLSRFGSCPPAWTPFDQTRPPSRARDSSAQAAHQIQILPPRDTDTCSSP